MFPKLIQQIINPPAFGLDISDLTVKYAKLKETKGGKRIDYFGEINIPDGIVVSGEIKNEKELTRILQNGLRDRQGKPIKDRFIVASLPEEKSFLNIVQLPKIKPEQIPLAIRWELEGNIPFPLNEIYFDYEVIPSGEEKTDHVDILVTAFPKTIVDSYVRVVQGAGFMPAVLELESQAISRALIDKKNLNRAIIILDLGATKTSFITFSKNALTLTLGINLGGRNFDQSIAKNLGISITEAEQIKKENGLDKNYKNGVILESVIPLLSELVDAIKHQVIFYQEHSLHRHNAEPDISAVILSGGDANLIGIERYLNINLKKTVVLGNPLINIYGENPKEIPPIPKNKTLKYATAFGLALRGMDWNES
ncbi:type IV pilus assembly protein PilM [Patescibacteria group bacterium]|nr:type IV pilus assembly protein PilM [Patescibacteria group bacterium]